MAPEEHIQLAEKMVLKYHSEVYTQLAQAHAQIAIAQMMLRAQPRAFAFEGKTNKQYAKASLDTERKPF